MSQQLVVMTPEELKRILAQTVLEVAESLTPQPQAKRLLTTEEVERSMGLKSVCWRSGVAMALVLHILRLEKSSYAMNDPRLKHG